MSAISSQLSFRSSAPWNFNPRVFNIMDSIYAIAFGLGLRTLVDAVNQDLKLTGSLIGLWEGVITLHFLKKMPKSSDPYIAYGVRLFIDFLVTESVERLVLVLIWSAFGLVLADVTPAIWDEVGLNRVWRHFRRDLYTIYDKIPTVAFFPPQRTVRFLPPRDRGRERLGEREREPGEFSPSIATSQDTTPIAVVPPSPSPSEPSEPLKHHVPGYYPGDYSDTDTDLGSINRSRTEINDTIVSDLDEGNQSSAISSPSLTHDEIPDMEEVLVDVGGIEEEVLPIPTPKQKEAAYINAMPPTPSDSAARWDLHRDFMEDAKQPPRQDLLPNILDSVEDVGTSSDGGWEKINRRDLDEDSPPTPPAKDRPVVAGATGLSIQIPPINPLESSDITENRRESLPPAYTSHMDDFEDMYYNPEKPTDTAADDHANVNDDEHVKNDNDDNNNNDLSASKTSSGQVAGDDFDINARTSANLLDVLVSSDVAAQAQADAAKMQGEEAEKEDEEERKRKEAEDEKVRKEAEDERIRKEAEDERVRKEAEDERVRKEAEDERVRKEAEDERLRKEAEDERIRKEVEDERIQKEAEETKRKEAEDEKKRKEAEELRREKEAEKKRKADETAERKKKEDDDEARRQLQRQEDAKRQEAEQKRKAEDAAKKEEEDAERKRQDEDALKKKEEEEEQEAAKKKREVEEQEARDTAEKQRQDEAATHAQTADTPGDQATEEKEDDSKTVHGLDIFGAQHQQGPLETDNVQDSTTSPHGDFTEEESVVSAATTDPPQEAKVRLERMMILRAQMVGVEKLLDELKGRGLDETSPEIKAAEKTLRKFRRQADRRYDAGVQLSKYFKGPDDNIFLGASDPEIVAVKIEENLEQLLTPTSRSISFKLTSGPSTSAKKQKRFVRDTLIAYNLFTYTTENEKNRKECRIEVPEGEFAEWLTEYRASVARRNAEEGDDEG